MQENVFVVPSKLYLKEEQISIENIFPIDWFLLILFLNKYSQ
jgi:hypothetical protein